MPGLLFLFHSTTALQPRPLPFSKDFFRRAGNEGEGRERIYVVEPSGSYEDDPNLTDNKFPGNPTKSYRSKHPLKIVAEVTKWEGHSPELLYNMMEHLKKISIKGIKAID